MVSHFLQPNRRNRSSLSQPANTAVDLNGTANISSASTSTSSGISSTNSSVHPTDGNFQTTRHYHATIDASAAMSMSNSSNSNNNFGYNVNNVGSVNGSNANNTVNNSNGNHLHQQTGMKTNATYDGAPPAHYTPPQHLTAEAVAALPPPGPFETATLSRHVLRCFTIILWFLFCFFLFWEIQNLI
jgi:hypothetical protein